MSSLFDLLSQQLDDNTVNQLSRQLGADSASTHAAINAALPMLLGALGRNASSADGARALDNALARDHDGSILNDVLGAVTSANISDSGAKILGHVLGGNQTAVQRGMSQVSGLDVDTSGQLLAILAPVVLGALGQTKRQNNLNANDLSDLLGGVRQQADSQLGGLAQLLDLDGDGSMVDDVLNIGSKLLGGLFGGKK
ncbi:MAG: DUF937 domain-containing protein [Caldilineaceae bacterium]